VERKLTLHSLAEREKGFDKTRAGGSEIDHNRRFELVWIWGTDAVGHRRRHKGSWVTGAGGGTRDSRSPHHTVTQQGRGVERFPSAVRALLALSDFGRSMEHLHGNGVVGGRLRVSQNTNIRRVGRQAREVRAPTQSLGSVGRSKAVTVRWSGDHNGGGVNTQQGGSGVRGGREEGTRRKKWMLPTRILTFEMQRRGIIELNESQIYTKKFLVINRRWSEPR